MQYQFTVSFSIIVDSDDCIEATTEDIAEIIEDLEFTIKSPNYKRVESLFEGIEYTGCRENDDEPFVIEPITYPEN